MQRRTFIGAVATATTIGIAGCAEEDESDSGVGGGIRQDWDKAVNQQNGKTHIDVQWQTWFNCSGYTSVPDSEVTLTMEIRAVGQVQAAKKWTVNYNDCMNEQSRTVSFTLDGEYEEILISVSHDQ